MKANKNLLSEEGKKLKTKKIIKLASIKKIRCIIPPIALKYFTGLTDERLNEIQKEVASLNDHDATWDIDVARHAQLKADYEKVYQLSKSLKGLYQTRYNRLQTFITKTTEANTAKRDAMIKENRRKEYKATPIPQSYAAYRSMMSAQDQISDDMSQEKSEKLIVLCIYFIKKFGCELTDDLVDDIFKCTKDTGAQMDRFFALAPLASASTQHRKEFLIEMVKLYPNVFKIGNRLTETQIGNLNFSSYEEWNRTARAALATIVAAEVTANAASVTVAADQQQAYQSSLARAAAGVGL